MNWPIAVAALSCGTFGLRLAGVALGLRVRLSPRLERGLAIAATVMLCALVVSATVSPAESGAAAGGYDSARIVGVAAAGLAAWRRAPLWLVVATAAALTAGLRWAGL